MSNFIQAKAYYNVVNNIRTLQVKLVFINKLTLLKQPLDMLIKYSFHKLTLNMNYLNLKANNSFNLLSQVDNSLLLDINFAITSKQV